MNNLNEVIIEGHLVRDPEIRWLKENEIAVCRFNVAVNKRYKDKNKDVWIEDTSYFLVESWRNLASMCFKYLKKGMLVRVVGELKQSVWKDSETDKSRERIYVIAEHVEFKQPKRDEEQAKLDSCSPVQDNLVSEEARGAMDAEAQSDETLLPF